MDDLLQKLRAAKPEARDQRDRRRRARLKDKHQVRVASGQQIPELGINVEDEEGGGEDGNGGTGKGKGMLSPNSETGDNDGSAAGAITNPTGSSEQDVADRAAAMLEGLQGGASLNRDGSLNVQRRREAGDRERQRRRERRNQGSRADEGGGGGGAAGGGAIPEEDGLDDDAAAAAGDKAPDTPVTVVHPPSPDRDAKARELPTPPPDER